MKLNNFGNIFKESERYLEENYLSSEYTWGFELEGFVHNSLTLDDVIDDSFVEFELDDIDEKNYNGDISDEAYECAVEIRDGLQSGKLFSDLKEYFDNERFKEDVFNYHTIDLKDRFSLPCQEFINVEDILYDTFKKYVSDGNYAKMTDDGSLKPNEPNDYKFEYNTPAMPFKPSVINDVIHMFAELENTEFYINDSCGFHIHLSYPNIKKEDLIWVLCCLAMDPETLYTISYLKNSGIKLFTDEDNYGSIDPIEFIRTCFERDKNWAEISELLAIPKMTAFRIHPQGTLEWRGPRNFLNKEGDFINYNNLYDLFKNLYKLTQFISRSLSKKFIEVNGEKISKEEVMKNILIQPRGISMMKSNSKVEKESWNKNYELFKELMRNGFDEEFVRTYLKKNPTDFIKWLKIYLGDQGRNSELNWLYEYFKRLKPGRYLYPYQYEMLDCIEFLS